MTDQQVYDRALAEMQRCQERIEELRAFLRVYEEFAGTATPTRAVTARSGKPRETAGAVMQDWERMVADVIRQAGHPLRLAEIYEAIAPMGFSVDSENPTGVLGTKLMRSPHFHKPARGVYALSENPDATPLVAQQETSVDDDADEEHVAQSAERRDDSDEADDPSRYPWEQAAKGA